MLDTRFSSAPVTEPLSLSPTEDDALPTIVVRAQDDARCRLALAQLGYAKVRSEFVRHKREKADTFAALGREDLWPAMDFVRDWLQEERNHKIARATWPFLLAMAVTIVAGLTFAAVATYLG
jgi:hypothetical protein